MKQTASILSTYAADVSGVCSALYELGGMSVMHDASGCNSTYNTHDEPRWYDMDSLVFISGLTEMDAMLGNDEKLIYDICEAARTLHPRFIALAGTPIPMVIGTDLEAVAARAEAETGIPAFAVATNGMKSYLSGASGALCALCERFTDFSARADKGSRKVNILGATPLDFSVNTSVQSMRALLEENGFCVNAVWAMGSKPDALSRSGEAEVNLVVSYAGLALARILKQRCNTPYVAGVPLGAAFSQTLLETLDRAIWTGADETPYLQRQRKAEENTVIIGESVYSGSLAAAVHAEYGLCARVLCPLETEDALMDARDCRARDEDDIRAALQNAELIIADPMYRPVCPEGARFCPLPHEAFSGRIYRDSIPDLIGTLKEEKK